MSNGIYIRIILKFIHKILNIDKKLSNIEKKLYILIELSIFYLILKNNSKVEIKLIFILITKRHAN